MTNLEFGSSLDFWAHMDNHVVGLAIFTEDLGWAVDDLSNSLPPIKERGEVKIVLIHK